MTLRTTVLLLVLVGGMVPQARGHRDAYRQILGACAAFASDGTSAAVTIDANNILLEIAQPSGNVSHLSQPLHNSIAMPQPEGGAPYVCHTYVDRKGDLVAVGIASRFPAEGQLQVTVADLKTLTWIGDWVVARESGFSSPSLAGFFEETTSLAVNETDLFPTYADARHNRLWFFRCEAVSAPMSSQPLCPIVSATLAGNELASPEFTPSVQGKKRTDLWFLPQSFAALDSDTILVAEGTMLWQVDMQAQTVDGLMLPKRVHYPKFEEIHGAAAISPDGQIIAVPLNLYSLAFPYLADNYVYKGTDIAVVRVRPLQLIGILPHKGARGPVAFAVDHRRGQVTILFYRKDQWERHELDVTHFGADSSPSAR